MSWTNIRLILAREIRDQLRDRRTLFMMAVLPILLYPLLGMSFLQISQFMHEHPVSVAVFGAENLPPSPRLLDEDHFAASLFASADQVGLLRVKLPPDRGNQGKKEALAAAESGDYDAVVFVPPDFAGQLERFHRLMTAARQQGGEEKPRPAGASSRSRLPSGTAVVLPGRQDLPAAPAVEVPKPEILWSKSSDKSQVASLRLDQVFEHWRRQIVLANLAAGGLPPAAAEPFQWQKTDVAEETGREISPFWPKLLPVMMLVWALTGAFYPAVDLCAGEKERGTLETLLSSPAARGEIVLGKLATIMLFSMITALLNVLGMGLTGWLILGRIDGIGPPPWGAAVWLLVALVPMSLLFSALCLALAAFARSTKEGQYYLMPLLLVTMPLVVLPMAPGVELNLGYSLIPVTGVVLLLKTALEGHYLLMLRFLPPVLMVTAAGALLAIRWAIDQFNSESVLFRESERLDVGLWLHHLLQDRQPTPTVAGAVFCGIVILLVGFFMTFAIAASAELDFTILAKQILVAELAVIATPTLLMTVLCTYRPRQTLGLRCPSAAALAAAPLLAVLLHPLISLLRDTVMELYPVSEQVARSLGAVEQLLLRAPCWQVLLLVAVVPAVCEELAFRGFILSGFRHLGHKWRAIVFTSIFFGLTHQILQQSLVACLVGIVIGYLAVQSNSIFPAMLFHVVNNSLAVVVARSTILHDLLARDAGYPTRFWILTAVSTLAASLVLYGFHRLPWQKSEEEERREAILKAIRADG
jgi:sodium transport system permease protein